MKIALLALLLVCAFADNTLDWTNNVQEVEATLPIWPLNNNIECISWTDPYKQCDAAWKDIKMGDKTICQAGSLTTSMSMALRKRGKKIDGRESNPGTLNAWLKTHGGYSGNLFVWGSVAPLGLKFLYHTTNHTNIRNCICEDTCEAILNVENGKHYVLATGFSGPIYKVNNPYSNYTQSMDYTDLPYVGVTRASLFRG
uniref:Sexual maturation-related protein n=1 Tax=Euplotes aediculatus TaxID=5940 RepID=B8Y446_EUPAE|nr:sexual maturation-related protein [Euplotes aediculatus]